MSTDAAVNTAPQQKYQLDPKFLNALLEAVRETFRVQCSQSTTPSKPELLKVDHPTTYDLCAVLGITEVNFKGSLAICFPAPTFLGVMGTMFGETFPEITAELEDGAGELLNIVYGIAKRILNDRGYKLEKAIPTIIRGTNCSVRSMAKSPTILIPFGCDSGKFDVMYSLL